MVASKIKVRNRKRTTITTGASVVQGALGARTTRRTDTQLTDDIVAAKKKRQDQLNASGPETRRILDGEDVPWPELDIMGMDMDEDNTGEAIGDGEHDIHLVFERISQRKRRGDVRTWEDRAVTAQQDWERILPDLKAAYLQHKHRTSVPTNTPDNNSEDHSSVRAFHVDTVDILCHNDRRTIPQHGDENTNVALLRVGFLGCTPVAPTTAYSLASLELYHRLRRRAPALSIQSWVRSLCDMHHTSYRPFYASQFSSAFDIYLNILRCIKQDIDAMLNRSTNWRLLHSCPACGPACDDEPAGFSGRLWAMDGNHSAKRLGNAGHTDPRTFSSDYFLPRADVDLYKDEVKKRNPTVKHTAQTPNNPNTSPDDPTALAGPSTSTDALPSEPDAPWVHNTVSGDVTDSQDSKTSCADHWKASAAQYEKRVLKVHEQTGIFAAACRHGFIQLVAEMVQSGELAKYPLAVLGKMLDTHGPHQMVGFDIGCSFSATVRNSRLLRDKVRSAKLELLVNAFHGYAHNRLCQLDNHPLYHAGASLEDFETMERVFSASNAAARLIRHASRFHYLQFLDLHFRQWDADKLENLGTFIYNNYKQATEILANYREPVRDLKALLAKSYPQDADLDAWPGKERQFLEDRKHEPQERILETAYVDALIKREESARARNLADAAFQQTDFTFHAVSISALDTWDSLLKAARAVETERRAAIEEYSSRNRAVADLEKKLGITESWSPSSPRFIEAAQYHHARKFYLALGKLQGLVVARLSELAKANMSGTGYKMRITIAKALKARCQAIRTALNQYHQAAAALQPPGPKLTIKDVVALTFSADFDIPRHTPLHLNLTSAPWAQHGFRERASMHFKMLRAREELARCIVEIRRVRANLQQEQDTFTAAITRAEQDGKHLLALELTYAQQECARTTEPVLARLHQVEQLATNDARTAIRAAAPITTSSLASADDREQHEASPEPSDIRAKDGNDARSADEELQPADVGDDRVDDGNEDDDDEEHLNHKSEGLERMLTADPEPMLRGGVPMSMLGIFQV